MIALQRRLDSAPAVATANRPSADARASSAESRALISSPVIEITQDRASTQLSSARWVVTSLPHAKPDANWMQPVGRFRTNVRAKVEFPDSLDCSLGVPGQRTTRRRGAVRRFEAMHGLRGDGDRIGGGWTVIWGDSLSSAVETPKKYSTAAAAGSKGSKGKGIRNAEREGCRRTRLRPLGADEPAKTYRGGKTPKSLSFLSRPASAHT